MTHMHFNKFAMVTQVDDKIFINASPEIRATFDARHRPIVEYFTQSPSFSEEQALKLIAPSRLNEMLDKRIFLRQPLPDLEGRYSRQLGYFSITTQDSQATQNKLRNAHVLIMGAGAIGSHSCWNLAAIGVGKITVLDFDVVEESNLNRQLMYTPKNIGELKVDILRDRVSEFNPTVELFSLNKKISSEADVIALLDGLGDVDLIIKAIDSPEDSMDFVNRVCVERGVPFVTGGFMDYVGVVGPNYIPKHSTCFACHRNSEHVQRLHGTGPTFAPLTTLVAAMVAMVSHKILIGEYASVADKVFSYNTVTSRWDTETAAPAKPCAVCGAAPNADESEASKQSDGMWLYRASLVTLMSLTLILRQVFDQPLVGVLTFTALLLSIPVVNAICGGNAVKARREFFVTACVYILFSIVAVVADSVSAGQLHLPHSMNDVFEGIRAVIGLIGQGVIGITVLFFLQSGCLEYVPRFIEFLKQDITEENGDATQP